MSNLSKNYKYCYIYKILNLINRKCYVGFHATNLEYDKDSYYGSGKSLKNAIKKYGENNFIKGIIEYIPINEWQEKEIYWIKNMNSHISLNGYNLTWGGDGTLGLKLSNSTKEKLSKCKINKKLSEDHRNRIGKSLIGRSPWNKDKKLSGDHLLKVQIAFLGKTHSEEARKKIGSKHKGKILSEETKNKLRGINLNKKISDSTKKKISNSSKGKKKSEVTKQKMSNSKIGIKRPTIICPYCQKEISDGNFQRWHGDNCKSKGKY